MSHPDPSLIKALTMAFEGTEAHVKTLNALAGLTADESGRKPGNVPHSIFQLLNHLVYWQGKSIEWLDGREPAWPEHAVDGWPGAEEPESQEAWDSLLARFTNDLETIGGHARRDDLLTVRGRWAPVQVLRSIASHNSYHLGQIALIRRMVGSWPPPGGGDTW